MSLRTEAARSRPDFTLFVPPEEGDDGVERHNMHLVVTPLPGGVFLATWTQAGEPHGPDQRVVAARSGDRGRTWSPPEVIDGPEPGTADIASWSMLVPVPGSSRVYCLYHKNTGVVDYDRAMTGVLAWRCSEDGGRTWGERFQTPIGRGAVDHSDPAVPGNWVTAGWQLPIATERGLICPITRWASREHRFRRDFAAQHHEGWFLRFDNILEEADPSRLSVTTLPRGDRGIRIPTAWDPEVSAAMEPAVQPLSDGRLLCLLRTVTGSIQYCLSADFAETWSEPRPLCFRPGGRPVPHPNAPVGFHRMGDGRFLLLFHNNDGTANGCSGPLDWRARRPVYASVGSEIDNPGGQPLAFSEPRFFYDNGGPERPHAGSLALYGTFFEHEGIRYWWYPDAIRFLLGRVVPDGLVS